jgi:hypothetical protein
LYGAVILTALNGGFLMFTPTKRQAGQGVEHIARKFQILTTLHDKQAVATNGASDEDRGLTLGQIAKAIGVSRSPHLRRLLETLYLEGAVLMRSYPYRKNISKHVWILAGNARWLAAYCELFDAYLAEGAFLEAESE